MSTEASLGLGLAAIWLAQLLMLLLHSDWLRNAMTASIHTGSSADCLNTEIFSAKPLEAGIIVSTSC